MLLSPAITKIHKGHHLWINQFQKFSVAISFIVIIHAQKPQQRVIYNCINMSRHRIIATKREDRSLIDFCICHQITVYKEALVCISRPDPFITFHPINKKDSTAKTECMLCHRPDLIQTFFSTMKSCFYRDIHILMICYEDNFSRLTIRNIRKTYCTAWTLSSFFVRLPAIIAVYRIDCFFSGFATADQYRLISIFKFCLQNRIQLRFKFIESSSVILRYTDWFINLFTVFPDCRILFRSGEIFALACRLWVLFIILCHPSCIRANHIAFYINTRKCFHTSCMDSNRNFSRTAGDLFSKWIFLFSCQHMSDRIGIYSERCFFLQMISASKSNTVAETFTLPESRPSKPSLHTTEILLHSMI